MTSTERVGCFGIGVDVNGSQYLMQGYKTTGSAVHNDSQKCN